MYMQENTEKIKVCKVLPYLVSNVIEVSSIQSEIMQNCVCYILSIKLMDMSIIVGLHGVEALCIIQ